MNERGSKHLRPTMRMRTRLAGAVMRLRSGGAGWPAQGVRGRRRENVLLSSDRAVAAGLCLASRVVLARLLGVPVTPDLISCADMCRALGQEVGPAGCNSLW